MLRLRIKANVLRAQRGLVLSAIFFLFSVCVSPAAHATPKLFRATGTILSTAFVDGKPVPLADTPLAPTVGGRFVAGDTIVVNFNYDSALAGECKPTTSKVGCIYSGVVSGTGSVSSKGGNFLFSFSSSSLTVDPNPSGHLLSFGAQMPQDQGKLNALTGSVNGFRVVGAAVAYQGGKFLESTQVPSDPRDALKGTPGAANLAISLAPNGPFYEPFGFKYVILASLTLTEHVLDTSQRSTTSPVVLQPGAEARSFIRFFNTAESGFTGKYYLRFRELSGNDLGGLIVSLLPNYAQQIDIGELIPASSGGWRVPTGQLELSADTDSNGLAQYVVWDPQRGLLMNMTNCETPAGSDLRAISHVHTSNLKGYVSQLVLTNKGAAGDVRLDVFDGQNGQYQTEWKTKLAERQSLTITMPDIEAAANWKPKSSQYHVTVRAVSDAKVALSHFIINEAPGITTDMTMRCALPKIELRLPPGF